MGQLNLPKRGIVCLDADAVIYAVEKIHPYDLLLLPVLVTVKAGLLRLVGSELLMVETLVKPLEFGDQALESSFRRFLTATRDFRLLPITRSVLESALSLRVQHKMRTPDAIHAATAQVAGCSLFITNDPVFRRLTSLPVAILNDYI